MPSELMLTRSVTIDPASAGWTRIAGNAITAMMTALSNFRGDRGFGVDIYAANASIKASRT
jgi:hypothetical protein